MNLENYFDIEVLEDWYTSAGHICPGTKMRPYIWDNNYYFVEYPRMIIRQDFFDRSKISHRYVGRKR
jgi:hypothetical protein